MTQNQKHANTHTGRRVNKLLIGPPGIGKTAHVRAQYAYTEVLLLSSCTEDDIAGLPYLQEGREMRTKPHWLERLLTKAEELPGERICLFLDELDKARREVADTLLTLVTHPHTYGLGSQVDIIAAANPPEWGGGDGISKPMLSRFAVIPFVPNVQFLCEYLREKFPGAEGFLRLLACGELPIFDMVGEGLDTRITCPRTIEMALQARDEKDREAIVTGLLTPNVAQTFLTEVCKKSLDAVFVGASVNARAVGKRRMPVEL